MSKIRQFWMVVPLDIKEDPSQGRIGGGQDMAMDVAPEQPRRARDALQPQPAAAYGFKIHSTDLKRLQMAFTSKQLADDYAKGEAEKHPKVLYGVFECAGTFETTTPTVNLEAICRCWLRL